MDEDEDLAEAVKEAVKPTKGKKKGKAVADTNGDALEPAVAVEEAPKAQEKPAKKGKKAKAVETEDAPVVEAPKEKAKPAKKGKKAEAVPVVEEEVTTEVVVEAPAKKSKKAKGGKKVEEPVEEIAEVIEEDEPAADGEVAEDDQTAALLAGFESDDDSENDPENDLNFDEDAPAPKLSKKQRTALEKAATGPRANEPGVIYVGYVH
jgi:nucleolar protein 15